MVYLPAPAYGMQEIYRSGRFGCSLEGEEEAAESVLEALMASAVAKDGKGRKDAAGSRRVRPQDRADRASSGRREGKNGVNSDDGVQPQTTKESDAFDERASLCSASPLLSDSQDEDAESQRNYGHDVSSKSESERYVITYQISSNS